MIQEEIIWEWIPNISVGVFKFQTSLTPSISELNLVKLDEKQGEWDGYEIPNWETRVYADDDGIVESVGCYDNLYYQGENLFQLTIDEIRQIMGADGDLEESILSDFQDGKFEIIPITFEEWGLTIWFVNGAVRSIIAFNSLQYL
jgi:hypothetical protein